MGHKILLVGPITPELNIGKLKNFVKKIVYIGVIDLVGHFLIGILAFFSKTFTKPCCLSFQSNTPLANTISRHTETKSFEYFCANSIA